ncbi:MAG: phosphatase PAP2 family protein [Verrucomicrobiales bacterium]|nr:phosphatase PAP2 family protein [Verrucomicrobiales bacterium]
MIRISCLAAALASAACVDADVVIDWNNALLEAIRAESTAPPLAARNLAMVHAAMYDAVNSIARTHQAYRFDLPAPSGALVEAAALGAAHEVAVNVCPGQRGRFDQLLETWFDKIPPGTNRESSLAFGRTIGQRMLDWRTADGASTTVPYIPRTEPGQWLRTAPYFRPPDLPHWADLAPFAMTNRAQFRPPGPPALNSAGYAADFNQVKSLGAANSSTRTTEQTEIARFWSDFSYTVTPPGHWNQIAQDVAKRRKQTLAENARLFALLNVGLADAAIIAWDAKFHFNLWRPITAIQEAGHDDNPETAADANWEPLLATPAFPEYVSGHSTFSGVAAELLAQFTGSERMAFSVGSDSLPGMKRSFVSFSECAEEIGMSRIYGGIHFLSADLDGLAAGKELGRYLVSHFFTASPYRSERLGR